MKPSALQDTLRAFPRRNTLKASGKAIAPHLARAITLIESSRPADRQLAEQIIEKCLTASGKSIRVGITGVPGAGKSSLIEALGRYLIKERGENVAVLAIDPSSQLSGGSILGDKTRMTFLASSDMAFIRPTPSRGAHGGVAQHTREAIRVVRSCGLSKHTRRDGRYWPIRGRSPRDGGLLLLVTLAGAGDELQGIKRGVMELANAVVINKADGNNIRAAERARTEAESALHFLPAPPSGWVPRALACSTQTGRGVADLWACVLDYVASTRESGWFEHWRQEQARRSMPEDLAMGLMYLFRSDPRVQERLMELEQQVLAGRITPDAAVCDLLTLFASRATQPAKHK